MSVRTEAEVIADAYSPEHMLLRAPVQGYQGGIPWPIHLEAYEVYCKRYGRQTALINLKDRGCRGGFSDGELDMFIPGWRERVSPITELQQRLTAAERELSELRASQQSFDPEAMIAAAEAADANPAPHDGLTCAEMEAAFAELHARVNRDFVNHRKQAFDEKPYMERISNAITELPGDSAMSVIGEVVTEWWQRKPVQHEALDDATIERIVDAVASCGSCATEYGCDFGIYKDTAMEKVRALLK